MIRPRLPCETAVVIVAAPLVVNPTQTSPSASTYPRTGSGLAFAEKDPSASDLGKKVAYSEIESPNDAQQILVVNCDPTDPGVLLHSALEVRLPGRMRQLQIRARVGKQQDYAHAQGGCVGADTDRNWDLPRTRTCKIDPRSFCLMEPRAEVRS
jgi:hypothetical protein